MKVYTYLDKVYHAILRINSDVAIGAPDMEVLQ